MSKEYIANFKFELKTNLVMQGLEGYSKEEIHELVDDMKITKNKDPFPFTKCAEYDTDQIEIKFDKKIVEVQPFFLDYRMWKIVFDSENKNSKNGNDEKEFIIAIDAGNGWYYICSELNSYDLSF